MRRTLSILSPVLVVVATFAAFQAFNPQPLSSYVTGQPPHAEPTFSYVATGGGNAYVLDTGLSADDCRARAFAYDMRFDAQYCELDSNIG